MIVYPAIDIKDGRCVRLLQGRFDDVTVYGDDPVQMASKWVSLGAKWLHIVDLDGARGEYSNNRKIILDIIKNILFQFKQAVEFVQWKILNKYSVQSASRAILGTSAVRKPELVKESSVTVSRQDSSWY